MSLLMEALKKAEAEKKKAALEQQSLQTQHTGEHAVAQSPSKPDIAIPPHTGTFDTSRFSLEPIERTPTPQPSPPTASQIMAQEAASYAAAHPEDAEDLSGREVIDLAAEEHYDYGEPISLTEPPTSQSAITHPAQFDQTSVLTPPRMSSEADVSPEAEEERSRTGEQIQVIPGRSGQVDSPMAAQSVFIRPARRRSPLSALAMLVGAGMLIFVAVLGIWYWKTVFPVRSLPASAIASATLPEVQPQANLEQAAAPAPPVAEQPAPPANTKSAPTAPSTEAAIETTAAAPTTAPAEAITPPAEPVITPAPPPEPALVAATETQANQPPAKPATETQAPKNRVKAKQPQEKSLREKPSKAKPQIAATDQNPASASMYDVSPGEIRISTVRGSKAVNPKVQEAYGAYQNADYPRAEQLYREVLDKQPDQRDALLGLAAIDQRRGDRNGAAELYGRLLRLNPNDAYAQAAWTAMRREQPTVGDESDLKLLLQQDPQAAHVHYLLGNVYARQTRWAEAQQAYFDAYKQDPKNTDYVYNLAVSLDHLGEREAALNYYRQALGLADKGAVNFATDQVLGRIQALSDAGSGGPP
jgi:tetratricopeptide (TPR) repeat protein